MNESNNQLEKQPLNGTTKQLPAMEVYKQNRQNKSEVNSLKVTLTVGQLIAKKRKEHGWTQEELAWRSGISRSQICRIERDECAPTVKSIEGLEVALDIELFDLFMTQKRKREREILQEDLFISSNMLQDFEKELADKGISRNDLIDVLNEALQAAEMRSKKKKR